MIWREAKHLESAVRRRLTARLKQRTLIVVVWESGYTIGSVERIDQPDGRHVIVHREYYDSVPFAQEALITFVRGLS